MIRGSVETVPRRRVGKDKQVNDKLSGMTAKIRFIEELAMNAWPAETIQHVDGWRVRYNHGVTRRGNSVWPNEWGGRVPLALKLDLIESFYSRRNLPTRFQICLAALPEGLDDVLEARGYTIDAPTEVRTAPLRAVLESTAQGHIPHMSEALTDAWFSTYSKSEGLSEATAVVRKRTLSRIGPRSLFVWVEIDGVLAAVGRGALERGWVGVFGMSTVPKYRRRGCATTILYTLAFWGRENGAENMYLQVMERNTNALSLYGKFGFERLYGYHYREKSVPDIS